MIIKAYAKINLDLKILGKRPDGYHELRSTMQALPDLYDVLEIVESGETEITCSDKSLACGESNLCAKALALIGKKAKIHIEKHIPIAAGLAGGSADGAAVIYAFEGASDLAYEHAAKLGSDVCFSLMAISKQGKAAAIATGRGEKLEAIDPIKNKIIVKTPAISVPTPAVYKEFDNNPISTDGGNDLQAPALRLFPEIQITLDELSRTPDESGNLPIKVQQSGSGPSCFAIYKEDAK
ncbi:MAG: 4-(cytidine 5'-diphospho)-2-C-methyl-D-erythritol kinase [Bacillota bacterium]|nr:4-(cytidine 5'-diphospho)-2-C-methyl-D-erythritol kinase [Bacillota bacterium]